MLFRSLMSVVPLTETYVEAYFTDRKLTKVRDGQEARAVSNAGIVFRGRVILSGVGKGGSSRVVLDRLDLIRHPLSIGAPMKVTIDTRSLPVPTRVAEDDMNGAASPR